MHHASQTDSNTAAHMAVQRSASPERPAVPQPTSRVAMEASRRLGRSAAASIAVRVQADDCRSELDWPQLVWPQLALQSEEDGADDAKAAFGTETSVRLQRSHLKQWQVPLVPRRETMSWRPHLGQPCAITRLKSATFSPTLPAPRPIAIPLSWWLRSTGSTPPCAATPLGMASSERSSLTSSISHSSPESESVGVEADAANVTTIRPTRRAIRRKHLHNNASLSRIPRSLSMNRRNRHMSTTHGISQRAVWIQLQLSPCHSTKPRIATERGAAVMAPRLRCAEVWKYAQELAAKNTQHFWTSPHCGQINREDKSGGTNRADKSEGQIREDKSGGQIRRTNQGDKSGGQNGRTKQIGLLTSLSGRFSRSQDSRDPWTGEPLGGPGDPWGNPRTCRTSDASEYLAQFKGV